MLQLLLRSISLLALFAATARADLPKAPPEALQAINQAFHGEYDAARKAALASIDPLVIEDGDHLILVHAGRRTPELIRPARYHELKAVDHIPLALYVILARRSGTRLDAAALKDLSHYRELLRAAEDALADCDFTPVERTRQAQLLGASKAILDQTIAGRAISKPALDAFARGTRVALDENADDAAHLELDLIDRAMNGFRKKLDDAAWRRLHVVVMGAHMARSGEISMQYFEKRLGEPDEGGRIVYAESLFTEGPALDLLATHVLDESVGAAFFGSPMRMHDDLLAGAGRAYLKTLHLAP